jgi:hypothetical protein
MTGASPDVSPCRKEEQVSDARQQHPNADSLAKMIADARRGSYSGKVGIRDRISCYQWTWFTMTMVRPSSLVESASPSSDS